MTNKSILEEWEERLRKEKIWMVFDNRQDEPVAYRADVIAFIKGLLQAQREKDKERLLEGMEKEVLKYDISGRHYLIEQLNKLINKIYESKL